MSRTRRPSASRPATGFDTAEVYQPALTGAELLTVINALHARAADYEKAAGEVFDPIEFADLVEHDKAEARKSRALADRLQGMRLARCRR